MNLNSDNMDIFVCSHKRYDSPVNNSVYKTISVGGNSELYGNNIVRDDNGDNISDMNLFYCELTGLYWIWKNYNLRDYVGICHYRRYFDFLDNIPDNLEDYDLILPTPLNLNMTIYQQYCRCHNRDDIKLVSNIMIDKYQISVEIINEIFNNRTYMHCYNMFICDKTFFREYCEFVFGILDEYKNINNISNINDVYQMVRNNRDKYLKEFSPNNTIEYQSRIGGYLSERLLNVFVAMKKPRIKYIDVIMK